MKRTFLLMTLIFIMLSVIAQNGIDSFVGTWIYQRNDTVFKIKLQKGIIVYPDDNSESTAIFGGYTLSVKDIMIENYISQPPFRWIPDGKAPSKNIYIDGSFYEPKSLGFTFYDQRIKHVGGEGIPCGKMHLIAPNKLHWILNEKEGLWWRVEGTDIPYELKGFSVPENVIMTKEE